MRFYNLVAILALGGVSAQENLRGAEPDDVVEIEDRDLLVTGSSGSYSKSVDISLWKCFEGDYCTDILEVCFADAMSYAKTYTGGSLSFADAEFFAYATCFAMAEAHACSFACVKAKAKLDLHAEKDANSGWYSNSMHYSLKAKLLTATVTFAKAATAAVAGAQAAAGGHVFTLAEADYCSGPGKDSYNCDPSLAAALGTANAKAFGDAFALSLAGAAAGSGSAAGTEAKIEVYGSSIDTLYGSFTAVALAFSWAEAFAVALAKAYAEACADAEAFAIACGTAYDKHCGCSTCSCQWESKEEACSAASAFAKAGAKAFGLAVASAAAEASAGAVVGLSWAGTLTHTKNDGKPLGFEFAGGAPLGDVGCAMVCPRY